jgi:hypothetical protein
MFDFNDLLERLDLDPARVRMLRHDPRGVAAWRRGRETVFGCFASFQKIAPSPYAGTDLACHFLPGPTLPDGDATALFFGTTRIHDRWAWDEQRLPAIVDADIMKTEIGRQNIEAFDLEWLTQGHDHSERLLIRWGGGSRAWSQWAHRQPKDILELRMHPYEPPFPGFAAFRAQISDIVTFPQSWIGALSGVKGIYLLVTEDGEQYVGSASGETGFIGRWSGYQENGHGGNIRLMARGHRDYSVSILEIASPDMAVADIFARESFWKEKLGSRAHGLNAN